MGLGICAGHYAFNPELKLAKIKQISDYFILWAFKKPPTHRMKMYKTSWQFISKKLAIIIKSYANSLCPRRKR